MPFSNFVEYYKIIKSPTVWEIYLADLSNMHLQTFHRSVDCIFEVQGWLLGKTSSEINSTEASDANRVPSAAGSLKNVE